MKKYILRLIAVLIFASATITSCSIEYRESHRRHYDNNGGRHYRDNTTITTTTTMITGTIINK